MKAVTPAESTTEAKKKAFVVGVHNPQKQSSYEAGALMAELIDLTRSIGLEVAGDLLVKIHHFCPAYLMGSGKMEEIHQMALALNCEVIVIDEHLSPSQQRNWEKACKMRVMDREEVIIEIFSQRAQTKEAVLQVKLAQMQYMLPRLRKAWTHLSRQRGGSANQKGEGETQLELDQRIIKEKIAKIRKELNQVISQRATQRKKRLRAPVPTGAIVGYTNAGKSSLLNKLSGAETLVADKLFATLDPTSRQVTLPHGQKVILTDTVGFIRRLPHTLIDAFKATLEEALVADFLIHVLSTAQQGPAKAH
jgi:GTPase